MQNKDSSTTHNNKLTIVIQTVVKMVFLTMHPDQIFLSFEVINPEHHNQFCPAISLSEGSDYQK